MRTQRATRLKTCQVLFLNQLVLAEKKSVKRERDGFMIT